MATQVYVKDLKRDFENKTGIIKKERKIIHALKGISFDIQEGEIFGLLGDNGAGKTTTIKILTTLLLPTSGEVKVLGYNPINEINKIRPDINFVFGGERSLYWRLSARANLDYFMDLYKLDGNSKKKKMEEVLELVKLTDRADDRVETYSKGMKQRLQIARGLINDPKIIFLDEPTIGLDPVGAMELRKIIKTIKELGKTVLLTTHYMYEADELCDKIAIMKQGEIITLDTPDNIKKHNTSFEVVTIESLGIQDEVLKKLENIKCVKNIHVDTKDQIQILNLQCTDKVRAMIEAIKVLENTEIISISPRDATLEDAYVRLLEG